MRRDKLGRRIGRNWWREYVTDSLRTADHAWWLGMEAATSLWPTEMGEWRQGHPRPTLRAFLVELAPSRADKLERVA